MWLKYKEWKQRQKIKRRKKRLKSSKFVRCGGNFGPTNYFCKFEPKKIETQRQVLCFTSLKNIQFSWVYIFIFVLHIQLAVVELEHGLSHKKTSVCLLLYSLYSKFLGFLDQFIKNLHGILSLVLIQQFILGKPFIYHKKHIGEVVMKLLRDLKVSFYFIILYIQVLFLFL